MSEIPFEPFFRASGAAHNVPWWMMAGMGKETSRFISTATHLNTNGTTDIGVMQINERNAPGLGLSVTDLYDPEKNIEGAAVLLERLFARVRPLVFWPHDQRRFVMLANNVGWGNLGQKLPSGPKEWEAFKSQYNSGMWPGKYAWVEKMDASAEAYRPELDKYKWHLTAMGILGFTLYVW